MFSAYLTLFFLTLTNPTTILSFTAISAGLGRSTGAGNHSAALSLVLGVFISWWLLLTSGVELEAARADLQAMVTSP